MAHKCDYCRLDMEYVEVLASEYRREVSELDSKVEALGGPMRCLPEHAEEVEDMRCHAAGLDDERAMMDACLEARH